MRVVFLVVALLGASLSTWADAIELAGSEPVQIQQHAEPQSKHVESKQGAAISADIDEHRTSKMIEVMKLHLSKQAQEALRERLRKKQLQPFNYDGLNFPTKVDLAMAGVPVLDQGRHGSCVTFAVTAAMDAAIEKGDWVSQLCSLSLGKYLEHTYSQPSGWDGTWGHYVLTQLDRYGYVNTLRQYTAGCGGLRIYPVREANETGKEMTPVQFARLSLKLSEGIFWDRLLRTEEAMSENFDAKFSLSEVKSALADGHRVLIGFLLDSQLGHAGAFGHRHKRHDTWLMTPQIEDDLQHGRVNSAHEVVITGYDDDVVVHGHKGILTLRNSWGPRSGDHGNYYMTYDYFMSMVTEGYRVYSRNDRPRY